MCVGFCCDCSLAVAWTGRRHEVCVGFSVRLWCSFRILCPLVWGVVLGFRLCSWGSRVGFLSVVCFVFVSSACLLGFPGWFFFWFFCWAVVLLCGGAVALFGFWIFPLFDFADGLAAGFHLFALLSGFFSGVLFFSAFFAFVLLCLVSTFAGGVVFLLCVFLRWPFFFWFIAFVVCLRSWCSTVSVFSSCRCSVVLVALDWGLVLRSLLFLVVVIFTSVVMLAFFVSFLALRLIGLFCCFACGVFVSLFFLFRHGVVASSSLFRFVCCFCWSCAVCTLCFNAWVILGVVFFGCFLCWGCCFFGFLIVALF